MKKLILVLLGVLLGSPLSVWATCPGWSSTKIMDNGSENYRLNIIIMGDGFDSSHQSDFDSVASNITTDLFNIDFYKDYEAAFNVYTVNVISTDNCVDNPSNATPTCDTALDTSYNTYGIQRCVLPGDTTAVQDAADCATTNWDIVVVVANDPEWGGCALGDISAVSNYTGSGGDISEVTAHEFGHAIGGLADEYDYSSGTYTGSEPTKANCTINPTSSIKWSSYLTTSTLPTPEDSTYDLDIGAFEGCYAFDTDIYRPSQHCKMLDSSEDFCDICYDEMVSSISDYIGVDVDEDGYSIADGDCDDSTIAASPDASESCDGIDNNCDGEVDEGCTYYSIGYENYGDASNPFVPDITWSGIGTYAPDIDALVSTELFGRDLIVQIGEETLRNVARYYFFSNLSDFQFSDTITVSGVDITLEGSLIDFDFSIVDDNKLNVSLNFYTKVSSSGGDTSAKGSGTLEANVAIETDASNIPQSLIIDTSSATVSSVSLSALGTITGVDETDLESAINSYLSTYFTSLRIPLADSLEFFNNFPNQAYYGATAESPAVKVVYNTYITGDEPFVMIGMNIFSGESSSIEDTVFSNFGHNIVSDNKTAPDNTETNVVIAVMPDTLNTLFTSFFDASMPYTDSTSGVTIDSFEATYQNDTLSSYLGTCDDYDCTNFIFCEDSLHGECTVNSLRNWFFISGSGTMGGESFTFGGSIGYVISYYDRYLAYYLEGGASLYTSIEDSLGEDFLDGVNEFFTLGNINFNYLHGEEGIVAVDESFGTNTPLNLSFVINDELNVVFHTLRFNQYDEDAFLNYSDIVFAGLIDDPDLSIYTADDDEDGISNIIESDILLTDPENADTDGDGLSDGDEFNNGLDPLNDTDASGDLDADGLSNLEEIGYGTSPSNSDTDSDGLTDLEEVTYSSCLDPNDSSDGEFSDTDRDSLTNGDEIRTYGSSPCSTDSDGDSLKDGEEVTAYGTDPADSDTDDDTLSDGEEVNTYTTDPLKKDTDNDSWSDEEEVNATVSKDPLVFDNLISPSQSHDFNGDGYSDLLAFGPDGNYCVIQSTGSRFSHKGEWIKNLGDSTSIPIVGDFNGDGFDDVASLKTDETIEVALSDGTQFVDDGSYTVTSLPLANIIQIITGDFNGDGKDDLAVVSESEIQILKTTTRTFTYSNIITLTNNENLISGDYNGDGEDDIAMISEGTISISLSASSDFEEWLSGFATSVNQAFSGDFNGDGLADIWVYNQETESIELATSWGDLFIDEGEITTDVSSDYSEILAGDFTGDGYVDFTGYTAGSYWRTSQKEMFESTGSTWVDTGAWKIQGRFEKMTKCQGAPFRFTFPRSVDFHFLGR